MATETTSLTDTSSTEALVSSSSNNNSLHKHLSLFDLVCVGVGATVGSGVYAVCGLIAHSQAGPATFISWSIAGVAASVSGLCYAELGGRYPTSGSSYVYVKETFENELASVVAGACLTLEYVGSASAVARSWGDKVVEYLKAYQGEGSGWKILLFLLEPGFGINPCAFAVSAAAVLILLNGVKESKCVTNLFTVLNITLLLFVTGAALVLAKAENLTPLIVPEFGTAGILRGATSSFFGYIGFDEICCIAGESKDPVRDLPRAVILTLIIVTTLYIAASIGLAGMVPYADVSETSGFPNGFRYRGYEWAAEVAAVSLDWCFITWMQMCECSLMFLCSILIRYRHVAKAWGVDCTSVRGIDHNHGAAETPICNVSRWNTASGLCGSRFFGQFGSRIKDKWTVDDGDCDFSSIQTFGRPYFVRYTDCFHNDRHECNNGSENKSTQQSAFVATTGGYVHRVFVPLWISS